MYSSHETTSVGSGQPAADDGAALVEDKDEHANGASHVDEIRSFIEQFGVDKKEFDLDIARGHRSSDGRPIVKIGGVGKFTIDNAADYASGKP